MAEALLVRYEDGEVAAVSKPPGLVAHPTGVPDKDGRPKSGRGAKGQTKPGRSVSTAGAGPKAATQTLAERLATRWPAVATVGPAGRFGLVHRLDKDTSGLVLVAKTTPAFESLTKQFADRRVEKRYQALVEGVPAVPRGRIDAPVGRHYAADKRERMTVHPDGRTAETTYEIAETFEGGDGRSYALLDVWPSTGRTHQIRVHLAALGHPVAGDTTYGSARRPAGLDRQFLHATEIRFAHPVTGKQIRVKDPLPADLETFLKGLR